MSGMKVIHRAKIRDGHVTSRARCGAKMIPVQLKPGEYGLPCAVCYNLFHTGQETRRR